jgi:hypothetical protein
MKLLLGTAILLIVAVSMPAAAEDVPCEKMLEDLRAALETAQPNEADAAKIKELEDKGIERCSADDDARADEFFTQAMKIVKRQG